MSWIIGLFIVIFVVMIIGGFTANRMSDIQRKIEDDIQMEFLRKYKESREKKWKLLYLQKNYQMQ